MEVRSNAPKACKAVIHRRAERPTGLGLFSWQPRDCARTARFGPGYHIRGFQPPQKNLGFRTF